ncbi:unnamed protein product [Owenia fusiformis]|uniref:Uncharacterized protein n=1 Tax=Owenia fusiformis TaxID=6347 RepID=A0A8J1ULJ9_OWEFU|nr:unnamed protein product [Owenia fusiformis]
MESMPPPAKRRKKKSSSGDKGHEATLTLTCEWSDCEDVYNDVGQMIEHCKQHLELLLTGFENENEAEMTLKCQWQGCGFETHIPTSAVADMNRHFFFHCFHTKLKCLGMLMVLQKNLQGCLLDPQSRNMIPELPEELQCGWRNCGIVIENPEYFYRHVEQHCNIYDGGNHLPVDAACLWEGCACTFKSRHKLKDHLRSHTQEKLVACPTCGGLFSNRTKFIDHLKRQADMETQKFQCSHCNKMYPSERLLRDHMRHHVNHYKCMYCDMTCPSPSGLRTHIHYRHTSYKTDQCPYCEHSSKCASDLRKHIEQHSEEPGYVCHVEGCDYKARSYSALSNHFKTKHAELCNIKYGCHLCDQSVSSGTKLTYHLKTKHNFKWPSGHRRFRYKLDEDGVHRLQTVRYESVELSEQLEREANSTIATYAQTQGQGQIQTSEDENWSRARRPKASKSSNRKKSQIGHMIDKHCKTNGAKNGDNLDEFGRDVIDGIVENSGDSAHGSDTSGNSSGKTKEDASGKDLYNLEMLGEVALKTGHTPIGKAREKLGKLLTSSPQNGQLNTPGRPNPDTPHVRRLMQSPEKMLWDSPLLEEPDEFGYPPMSHSPTSVVNISLSELDNGLYSKLNQVLDSAQKYNESHKQGTVKSLFKSFETGGPQNTPTISQSRPNSLPSVRSMLSNNTFNPPKITSLLKTTTSNMTPLSTNMTSLLKVSPTSATSKLPNMTSLLKSAPLNVLQQHEVKQQTAQSSQNSLLNMTFPSTNRTSSLKDSSTSVTSKLPNMTSLLKSAPMNAFPQSEIGQQSVTTAQTRPNSLPNMTSLLQAAPLNIARPDDTTFVTGSTMNAGGSNSARLIAPSQL